MLRDQNELIAESSGNWPASLHQRLQMRFGRELKIQNGLASFRSVRMASWQEVGLRNPNAVFILAKFDFGNRN